MLMGSSATRATFRFKGHRFDIDPDGVIHQDGKAIAVATVPVLKLDTETAAQALHGLHGLGPFPPDLDHSTLTTIDRSLGHGPSYDPDMDGLGRFWSGGTFGPVKRGLFQPTEIHDYATAAAIPRLMRWGGQGQPAWTGTQQQQAKGRARAGRQAFRRFTQPGMNGLGRSVYIYDAFGGLEGWNPFKSITNILKKPLQLLKKPLAVLKKVVQSKTFKTIAKVAVVAAAVYFTGGAALALAKTGIAMYQARQQGGGEGEAAPPDIPAGGEVPTQETPAGTVPGAGYQVANLATQAMRAYAGYQVAQQNGIPTEGIAPVDATGVPDVSQIPVVQSAGFGGSMKVPLLIGAAAMMFFVLMPEKKGARKGRKRL